MKGHTGVLRVRVASTGDAARRHRDALAGLPLDYRVANAGADDVVVADPWQVASLLRNGMHSVVVANPSAWDVSSLAAGGAVGPGLVVPFVRSAMLLDGVSVPSDPRLVLLCGSVPIAHQLRGALLEQLAAVRLLIGPISSLQLASTGSNHIQARADVGGEVVVHLSAVVSAAQPERLSIDVVAMPQRWSFGVSFGAGAKPTKEVLSDEHGDHVRTCRYESAERLWWLALRRHLADRTNKLPYDLARLETDLRLLDSLGL